MNEKKSVERSDSVFVDEEERSRREVVSSDADERNRSSWRRLTASACREEVTIAASASRSAFEVVESTESVERRMRFCWARIWVEKSAEERRRDEGRETYRRVEYSHRRARQHGQQRGSGMEDGWRIICCDRESVSFSNIQREGSM